MTSIEDTRRDREVVALEQIAATLGLIADTLDAYLGMLAAPPAAPTPCEHPVDQREDLGSTMGHPRYHCKRCGFEVR